MPVPNTRLPSASETLSCQFSLQRHITTRAVFGIMVLLAFFVQPRIALADDSERIAVETLEEFIQTLSSFEASFEQTVYDTDSSPLTTSRGSIRLKRPARFIWIYSEPEPQTIVGDGQRIWLYDEDLEQVTVNDIDERINGTPLQLLMSAAPLGDGFDIASLGESDGIDWFGLTPLTPSSDFEQVYIGLKDDGLAAMELRDTFGQATQIRLSDFKKDIDLDDKLFVFEVPDGVDVIGLDE